MGQLCHRCRLDQPQETQYARAEVSEGKDVPAPGNRTRVAYGADDADLRVDAVDDAVGRATVHRAGVRLRVDRHGGHQCGVDRQLGTREQARQLVCRESAIGRIRADRGESRCGCQGWRVERRVRHSGENAPVATAAAVDRRSVRATLGHRPDHVDTVHGRDVVDSVNEPHAAGLDVSGIAVHGERVVTWHRTARRDPVVGCVAWRGRLGAEPVVVWAVPAAGEQHVPGCGRRDAGLEQFICTEPALGQERAALQRPLVGRPERDPGRRQRQLADQPEIPGRQVTEREGARDGGRIDAIGAQIRAQVRAHDANLRSHALDHTERRVTVHRADVVARVDGHGRDESGVHRRQGRSREQGRQLGRCQGRVVGGSCRRRSHARNGKQRGADEQDQRQ